MKIIDLLNKISNGEEVPNRVRFDNIEWNRVYGEKNVYYIDEYDSDLFIHFFRKNLDFTLNDEVEILEEKKIPEKIDIYVEDDEKWIQVYNYDTIPLDKPLNKKALSHEELVIIKTLNQIIDYLKSKGE